MRFDDIEWGSKKDFLGMMQGGRHGHPDRRTIKHVVLDADDTIWEVEPWGIVSHCRPSGQANGDLLTCRSKDDNSQGNIRLAPTLRETIESLKRRGIGVSIASINDREAVEKILDAFGLLDSFSHIEADFTRGKDAMVCAIGVKEGVMPAEILFVDDSIHNVADVDDLGALSLQKDMDIMEIRELLNFIE